MSTLQAHQPPTIASRSAHQECDLPQKKLVHWAVLLEDHTNYAHQPCLSTIQPTRSILLPSTPPRPLLPFTLAAATISSPWLTPDMPLPTPLPASQNFPASQHFPASQPVLELVEEEVEGDEGEFYDECECEWREVNELVDEEEGDGEWEMLKEEYGQHWGGVSTRRGELPLEVPPQNLEVWHIDVAAPSRLHHASYSPSLTPSLTSTHPSPTNIAARHLATSFNSLTFSSTCSTVPPTLYYRQFGVS